MALVLGGLVPESAPSSPTTVLSEHEVPQRRAEDSVLLQPVQVPGPQRGPPHPQPSSRSGPPFPSYHTCPLPAFPGRTDLVKGYQVPAEPLRASRIRLVPDELAQYLAQLAAEEGGVTLVPTQRLNLSHQSLGDEYQLPKLRAVLCATASSLRTLALTDNFLTDLRGLYLPCLQVLFLAQNNIQTFEDLPDAPLLLRLCLAENFIADLTGLTPVRYPRLHSLTLRFNPVARDPAYRGRVKAAVPMVCTLDGTPLRPRDFGP